MIRFVAAAGAAATCLLLATSAQPVAAPDARSLPMRFDVWTEGPAQACGSTCRTWVSASGAITSETPRDFDAFAKKQKLDGATIALDSDGGSVLGALALGRSIRKLGMTTTVGKTVDLKIADGSQKRAKLLPKAYCESMCAFVLLAGVERRVPAEARVTVHQIWLGDRRDDATAAIYSAEDIMVIQRDIGRLVQYTAEMGGGADLIETALRIPPWERLRPLNAEELIRAKLQTAETPFEPLPPEPAASSSASTSPTIAVAAITDRAWSMIEKSGRPMLARRHPLTIEGEEIGSFDLVFSCSGTSGSYTANYTETRKRPGTKRTPVALKDVSISVGRESAVLRVVASESAAKPPELLSSARGIVSAALMKGLAEWGNRAVMIETATTNNQETAIRVGNTGLAQYFTKFAAACAK
jgi:hypothetical protein